MKSYEDFLNMTQDELYDFRELVGSDWAILEFLTARRIYEEEKKLEEYKKIYQWED